MSDEPQVLPEVAYYYPEPYWLMHEGGWVKTLLLFFDKVSILLPAYMRDQPRTADPSLFEPLEDLGLLQVLEPEWFVDATVTERLTEAMVELVTGGAFDGLPENEPFTALSMSRMGLGATDGLAEMMYEELAQRGLARESQDGVSVPMHSRVRFAYLFLLAQIARDAGRRYGFDLHPATNDEHTSRFSTAFFNLKPMPSHGHVVRWDTRTVGIDLDEIPLNEVLAFRKEGRNAHRKYMGDVRRFTLELSLADDDERHLLLEDRRAELEEEGQELKSRALSAWKSGRKLTGFGIGLAGAAWSLASMNPIPAVLGALGAANSMLPDKAGGSVHSYLFEAHRELG